MAQLVSSAEGMTWYIIDIIIYIFIMCLKKFSIINIIIVCLNNFFIYGMFLSVFFLSFIDALVTFLS